MKKTLLKACVLGLMVTGWISTGSLFAQSDPSGKKRVTSTYAITNATVITAPGKAGTKATVLIKDGVIAGVGSNLSLPMEAQVVPGDSLFIYPGFIAGASEAGITRPDDPERPKDFNPTDPADVFAGVTPWRSALDQYSAESSQVEDFRKAGFTIAQILPDGGMLAGKAAIVLLGSEYSTNVLKTNSALAANFSGARGVYPGTAVGVMAKFRDVYQNTKLTKQRADQFQTVSGSTRPEQTSTYSAMMDVISSEVPVMFEASNDLEVRRAISLQKELGFKLILTGLDDYSAVIDVLKEANVPVLISLEVPDDKAIKAQKEDAKESVKEEYARVKEAYEGALKQASLLEEAGIAFGFSVVNTKAGDVKKTLASLIENGLSEEAALAALTTNPASILGINRIAGSIEKGKLANLVITTDSLFSEDSQVKHVVVDGYVYDYETKAKKKKSNSDGDKVEVAGNWDYTSESPAGKSGGVLEISQDGSDYTGSITYDDPSGNGTAKSDIKNVTVDGSNLSFDFDVAAGGMSLTVTVSGEVDGSSFEGNMNVGQFGTFPFSATLNPTLIANK